MPLSACLSLYVCPTEAALVFATSTSDMSGFCGQTLRLLEEGGQEGPPLPSNSTDDMRILNPSLFSVLLSLGPGKQEDVGA